MPESISYKKAWVLCRSGAHNALARLDEGLGVKPDAQIIQPLCEALWWICAADETLMEEYPNQYTKVMRKKLVTLPLIHGLRWARNRITHQLPHWEIAKAPFNWEEAEKIAPKGSIKLRHDGGRDEYIAHLQRHDAREAIRDVIKDLGHTIPGRIPAQGERS